MYSCKLVFRYTWKGGKEILLVLSYELAVSMIENSNRKAKKCGLQIAAMMESDKWRRCVFEATL